MPATPCQLSPPCQAAGCLRHDARRQRIFYYFAYCPLLIPPLRRCAFDFQHAITPVSIIMPPFRHYFRRHFAAGCHAIFASPPRRRFSRPFIDSYFIFSHALFLADISIFIARRYTPAISCFRHIEDFDASRRAFPFRFDIFVYFIFIFALLLCIFDADAITPLFRFMLFFFFFASLLSLSDLLFLSPPI